MRLDPIADLVDDVRLLRIAIILTALSAVLFVAISWDRGWPPFHRRPARVFAFAARRLGALTRQPDSNATLSLAARDLHRAFDAAGGKTLLRPDLEEFFRRRPEFASLKAATERFFEASEGMFFAAEQDRSASALTLAQLAGFAKALAEKERAR